MTEKERVTIMEQQAAEWERKYREEERRFNALADPVCSFRPEKGKLERFNNRFREICRIAGVNPEVATFPGDFVGPDDFWSVEMAIQQCLETGRASVEFQFLPRNGVGDVYEFVFSSIPKNSEESIEIIAVGRPVGERILLEDYLDWQLKVSASITRLYRKILSSPPSLPQLALTVVESALTASGGDFGYVSVIDRMTGDAVVYVKKDQHPLVSLLKGVCAAGEKLLEKEGGIQYRMGRDSGGKFPVPWGQVLNTQSAFYSNYDVQDSVSFAFLSAPVSAGNSLLGQIGVAGERAHFGERSLEALLRIAEVFALAVQRIWLHEELFRGQSLWNSLLGFAPMIFAVLDADGVVMMINQPLPGYNREDILGHPLKQFFSPDWHDVLSGMMDAAINGRVEWVEKTCKFPSGDEIFMSSHAAPIRMGEHVDAILFIFNDITRLKQTELALRESEHDFRQLFENANDGILIIDLESLRILDANASIVQRLGYSHDELLSMDVFQINGVDDPERVREILEVVVEKGGDLFEHVYRRKDGSLIPIEISNRLIVFRGRNVVLSFIRDISERKKNEAQMKASLEEKVVLLQELHHRVKNNMAVISSLLNLQAAREKSESTRHSLQNAQNRIRAMSMVHELSYQSGNFLSIDLKEYLLGIAANVSRTVPHAVGSVSFDIQSEDISLDIKKAIPCGLIVNELLSNSFQFAFPGERRGKIKAAAWEEKNSGIVLEIGDDGVGLPQELDVESSASLGLSLVGMMVKQLKGRLEIQKSPGALFRVFFPR